jgi:uncharacterized protein YndB with AHSA1/START domain
MRGEEFANREIASHRAVAAPRARVWTAWTDPALLARWWGPKGFRNTFHEFDPRPGGAWRFVMHAPDGADYPSRSVFLEVVRPERIVFRHLEPVHEFLATALFAERDGGTEIVFRMRFDSAAERERVESYVVDANEQNFDRLEALLAEADSKGDRT